jgi:hypothetical protein
MAEPIILSGQSYYEVVVNTAENSYLQLNPIDNNGNLWDKVTVVVTTENTWKATVILPCISTKESGIPSVNNQLGIQINVVASQECQTEVLVVANPEEGDTIGSLTEIPLQIAGSNVVLSPISPNIWSATTTR